MAASERKEEEKGGNNNNDSEDGGSGCPVLLKNTNKEINASPNYSSSSSSGSSLSWNPLGWLRSSSSSPFPSSSFKVSDDAKTVPTPSSSSITMEVSDGEARGGQGVGGCPVKHRNTPPIPLRNKKKAKGCDSTNLPPSIEEAARHAQSPAPGQTVPLSTRRVISSIPRGGGDDHHSVSEGTDTFSESAKDKKQPTATKTATTTAKSNVPHHQPTSAPNNKWVYPSEQQFYNAILRKGYTIPDEAVVPNIVRIHNAVNERAWSEIIRWERTLHGSKKRAPITTGTGEDHRDGGEDDDGDESRSVRPKLVKFYGRPQDLSPKAFINTHLLWYTKPFDRHDWYVDRYGDGTKIQRYVIDFYSGDDGSDPQQQQQEEEQEQEQNVSLSVLMNLFSTDNPTKRIGGTKNDNGGCSTDDDTADDDKQNLASPKTTTTTMGKLAPTNTHHRPPAMYLDVRPALDDFDSLCDRMRMFVRDAFPGIFDVFATTTTNVTKREYTAAGTATASTAAAATTTTPDASSARTTAPATTPSSASKNST